MLSETDALPEKRNSGHTGPTSPEGKAISSQNAVKHGGCAKTLILPGEFEEDWLLLLARWRETYHPAEKSLEPDLVLKVAQAEWHRIRAQHSYDDFLASLGAAPPHAWDPGEIKRHDLSLRYKTAAERTFHREYRVLEQHTKAHPPKPAAAPPTPPPVAPGPPEPFSGHRFCINVNVNTIDGQTTAKFNPQNESTLQWICEKGKPGGWVQRFFTFHDGVPPAYEWMFPDPATRLPPARFSQSMTFAQWLRLYVAEQLHPSGLPLDPATLAIPESPEILR